MSHTLFNQAQEVLVGGVNSPVRAFKSVGGSPIFMKKGQGPYLTSEDNKTYIDYVLSWGPMILGHADPDVTAALIEAVQQGTSFGTPSCLETQLAQCVQTFYPSMEKLRFVSSGTEACMSAIRLARGFTQRSIIIKFNGCYHGHADSLLVAAGSGGLTLGQPDSEGVLPDLAQHTVVVEYNDSQGLKDVFETHGAQIAGVIVEPVVGNMGVVLPQEGFLETLRLLCTDHGAVLIFDEVMCGFRVHLGGAQALYAIKPDLTCLGKVIGGGLPCAAFGGRADIMAHLAPVGGVYQAGTLSGNPVAMTAGLATLTALRKPGVFEKAISATQTLVEGMIERVQHQGQSAVVNSCGTMFSVFFTPFSVSNLASAKVSDTLYFNRYFHAMLAEGVYLAPSQFEANFLSTTHTPDIIETTLRAFEKSLVTA